jgi:hypothetical protein
MSVFFSSLDKHTLVDGLHRERYRHLQHGRQQRHQRQVQQLVLSTENLTRKLVRGLYHKHPLQAKFIP